MLASGLVPANKSGLLALLEKGYHTGVAIDGIAGIFADAQNSGGLLVMWHAGSVGHDCGMLVVLVMIMACW